MTNDTPLHVLFSYQDGWLILRALRTMREDNLSGENKERRSRIIQHLEAALDPTLFRRHIDSGDYSYTGGDA